MGGATRPEAEVSSLVRETAAPCERQTGGQQARRLTRSTELASAILMAAATIATAWCGYQAARWNGKQTVHTTMASTAVVRAAKFANLAEQKNALHTQLFGQWVAAAGGGN